MSYKQDLAAVYPNFRADYREELWKAWCNYKKTKPATQEQLEEWIKPLAKYWRKLKRESNERKL